MQRKNRGDLSQIPDEIDYHTAMNLDYNSIVNICNIGLTQICKNDDFWWDKINYEIDKHEELLIQMDRKSKDKIQFIKGYTISRKQILKILNSEKYFEINDFTHQQHLFSGEDINNMLQMMEGDSNTKTGVYYKNLSVDFKDILNTLYINGLVNKLDNYTKSPIHSLPVLLYYMDNTSKDYIKINDYIITRLDAKNKSTYDDFMIWCLNNNYYHYIRVMSNNLPDLDYIFLSEKLDESIFGNIDVLKFLVSKINDDQLLDFLDIVLRKSNYEGVKYTLSVIGELTDAEFCPIFLSTYHPDIVKLILSHIKKVSENPLREYTFLGRIVESINIESLILLMSYYYEHVDHFIDVFIFSMYNEKRKNILINFLRKFLKVKNWKDKVVISKDTLQDLKRENIPKKILDKLFELTN